MPVSSFINILKRMIGILFFGEIFLLGSGQVVLLPGGISLKMLNYALMIVISSIILFIKHTADKDIIRMTGLFSGTLLLGILISTLNGGLSQAFTDLSPLLYFFTFFFFYFYIRTPFDITFIKKILQISAVIMAIFYLLYIWLIELGILNFDEVYLVLKEQSDILFRGNDGAFFYKGFLYLAVGLVFYIVEGKMFSWQSILLLVAIYFTRTRGFLVIALFAGIFYCGFWIYCKHFLIPVKQVLWTIIALTVIVVFATGWYENFVGVDRGGGDAIRVQTFYEVVERITPLSFWVGHGFGVGVPIRPIHMEMSYLEIFHKQGIVGLLFWGYLFLSASVYFLRMTVKQQLKGLPFMLAIIMIYIQSLFNPFLNNPIGMSFVLISYIVLKRIFQFEEAEINDLDLS